MPLYDYRCRDCGHEFEVQQSISDDPLATCAQCGGELRKVFSPVGISFKGSGFYKNDSRSSTRASSKPKASESGSGSESDGGTPKATPSSDSSSGSGKETSSAGAGSKSGD